MKRSYGYHSYRGRGRGRGLRAVLIAVIVLLVLAACAFVFLSRYLVYTDDGVRLDLPFARGEQQREEDPPEETGFVVESQEPDGSVVVEPFRLRAVELSPDSSAEEVLAALAEAGANAVVLDMKTDEGYLSYVSDLEAAIGAGVCQAGPDRNDALRALNGEEGVYTVARISCFRDLEMSSDHLGWSVMSTNGYRWRDPERLRWLSPMSDEAVSYLLGVMEELCGLGFDEILLDHCAFPTGEKTDSIAPGANYPADAGAREQAVRSFLEQARALTESRGVKLSVRTGAAALEGQEAGGLTASALLENADRLWVDAAQLEAGVAYLTESDRAAAEEKLVTVLPADGSVEPPQQDAWARTA